MSFTFVIVGRKDNPIYELSSGSKVVVLEIRQVLTS